MTDTVSLLALVISVVSILIILYILVTRLSSGNLRRIYDQSIRDALSNNQVMRDQLKASLAELRIDADISAIRQSTTTLSEQQRSLTEIFTNKSSRGYFGEQQLEDILKDSFGSDWIHVREKISSDIEIPDIHFDTPQGKLCVDSKFPLENYQRIFKAKQDEEKSRADNDFKRDFNKHVKKVAGYVKPESGTARIALMYLPAESIYAYVAEEHPEWMDEAAKANVLIVSPSSIIPQLAVIRSYVEAEKIVKHTDAIKRKIEGYQRDFHNIAEDWKILRGHIDNARTRSNILNDKVDSFGQALDTLLTGLSTAEGESHSNEEN